MEYKTLKPSDADSYRHIRLKALQNNPEAFASSYEEEKDSPIEKYIHYFQSERSFTIGAFENGNLVGVITLVKEVKNKLRHRANIFAMYVNPENRGKGIGKTLLTEVIKKAKDLDDVEQINLSVVSTNDAAIRLYSSMGFEVFGTEKNALKCGSKYFDEEHMVLFL